jgi:hypothetical protein
MMFAVIESIVARRTLVEIVEVASQLCPGKFSQLFSQKPVRFENLAFLTGPDSCKRASVEVFSHKTASKQQRFPPEYAKGKSGFGNKRDAVPSNET